MFEPEIDYLELPSGRIITVCATHHLVTCGKCCFDFSLDLEGDEFDIYLDGYGEEGSPSPRYVSFAQVANSRFDRPEGTVASGSRGRSARLQSTRDEEDGDSSDGPPPLIDDDDLTSTTRMGEGPKIASGPSRVPVRTNFSGTLFATTFNPQYSPETMLPLEPKDLFPPTISMMASPPAFRFINRYNTTEALIYTDGSCLDNGDAEARGGYAFYFKPVRGSDKSGLVAMKLEDKGLDGLTYRHTSNRAELRAALAALRYKSWWSEGLKSLVIATDSSYVVNSATDWARSWISKGWRTSRGEGVKNRDLWEALLLAVEMLHDHGVNVHFWHIPRKFNNEADRAAKDAALVLDACDVFGFGFMQSYDWGSTR